VNGDNGTADEPKAEAEAPVGRSAIRTRMVVLIALAVVVLTASIWHVFPAPTRAPVATSKTATAPKLPTSTPTGKRPYGVLHMDGLDIPSPQMHAAENDFIHTLISHGFVVQRVDPSAWDARFNLADADIVTTNHGDVNVIAPYDPNRPVWVCSRGVAITGGADVPVYELGAADVSISVQIAGPVFFGHVGEVLVFTQDQGMWQRLNSVVAPVTCPSPSGSAS
jgi:hypothetical protein